MSPEQSPGKIGKSVGEKLRAARIALNYTQSKLASPDFSVSYISAIERGQIHPSLRALEILAARLGLSSTQLLPNRAQQDAQYTTAHPQPEREEDESELLLLEAQILIRQGDAAQAITKLGKIAAKRLKLPQQVQHRYLLGWALLLTEHYQECEHTLSEAIPLAKEMNNRYLNIHLLNKLGMTYAAMQNYAQALFYYQRCLELLLETDAPRDSFLISEVYVHLGEQYIQLENPDDAVAMFNMAFTEIKEFDNVQKIQALYAQLKRYYAIEDDFFISTIYDYQSLLLSQQESNKHLKDELYHYLGQATLKGNQEGALAYLRAAEEKESDNQLILASLNARTAEWYFSHQQLTEALRCAQDAYTLAHPFGDTLITADTLIVLGRIEYAKQDFDSGDTHFAEGLAMLEQLHRLEELAGQAVLYAQLLEQRGKEREAFTYFRRAYESSQKLGR